MRSLTLKLTIAFLAVSLISVTLVAFFVEQQTRREFDQFVLDRYQLDVIDDLIAYYENNGGWNGVGPVMIIERERHDRRPETGHSEGIQVTVVDADNVVVAGSKMHTVGQKLSHSELEASLPAT